MKIRLYWHIWLTNHWRHIVKQQHGLMRESELWPNISDIQLSLIGSTWEVDELLLSEEIGNCLVIEIVHEGFDQTQYEFPAMRAIYDDAKEQEPFIAFYIHSKGVSYPDDKHANWRDILNEGVITKWREHIKAIESGAQVSGQNFIPETENNSAYFSGNFWAADSRYIATLADPRTLDQTNRYEAERWICSGNPRVNALPFIEPNP